MTIVNVLYRRLIIVTENRYNEGYGSESAVGCTMTEIGGQDADELAPA